MRWPRPGPISTMWSAAEISAVDEISARIRGFLRKFWPRDFFGGGDDIKII